MLILKDNHPAREKLKHLTEIITPKEAQVADIRALRLGILNLMPVMDETERDILQSIGHSILQIEPVWIKIATREKTGKNTSLSHINDFYVTMEQATKEKNLDGLIITGAPIELLDFEEVEYWDEFKKILDYARKNIYSTMFLCWAAMAASYHFYKIPKVTYPQKLVGCFTTNNVQQDNHPQTKGMNPIIEICQSRHTGLDQNKLNLFVSSGQIVELLKSSEKPKVLNGDEIGVIAFASKDLSEIYNLGHFEYHEKTIDQEVKRDKEKNQQLNYPIENYYLNPEIFEGIKPISWRSSRTIFYGNFLNIIYQLMNKNIKAHNPFVLG
ncbi:MAG: homoserine O-succinyltransferase [Candidatus Pacearchaeota archaeon]|jgi:homoserine O-succinyltransferase